MAAPNGKGTAARITKKFNPSYYVDVYKLAKEGLTDKEIANALRPKAKYTAFVSWKRKDKAFARAIQKGRDELAPMNAVDRLTNPNQMAFLIAYAQLGTNKSAAEACGLSKWAHVNWMRNEEQYRDAFQMAEKMYADSLMDEATRRGRDGVRRYQFHQGRPIMVPCDSGHPEAVEIVDDKGKVHYRRHWYELEYSNPVLVKLLQAKVPEFKDTKNQTNVAIGIGTDVIAQALEAAEAARSNVINPATTAAFAEASIQGHLATDN